MTALARSAKPTSGLQDICRDWSATERCSAVTIALALIALHIAIAHSL